jgi:ABC-type multidrug transport system ATPase subunit
MRVDEVLALAAAVRRETPREAPSRLHVLGVEALAARPVRTLSPAEVRAVALAEAATSEVVKVILVEEPLLAIDPRAAGRVAQVLRDRARDGCSVVVATGSVRDASDIADDLVALRVGAVVAQKTCAEALVSGTGEAHVRVVLQNPRDAGALIAALAKGGHVNAVERDEGLVALVGSDASALAQAAGEAAILAEVELAELRVDPPGTPYPVGPAARGTS